MMALGIWSLFMLLFIVSIVITEKIKEKNK